MTAPAASTPRFPPARTGSVEEPRLRWWTGVAYALIGSLWLFGFAPRAQTWAVAPGVVGMLAMIERARKTKHAIGYVFLFGAIAIGYGYRWLADTVRTFGELDSRVGVAAGLVSWLVLVVYAMWSTIHIVIFTVLYRAMRRSGVRPHPLAVAALFTACEAIPIRFLAWSAGYGAVECAPLRQLAEWGGVSLVSFALLCFAVPLYEGLRSILVRVDGPMRDLPRPRAAFATLLVGLALYGGGWWRLAAVDKEDRAVRDHVRVGLVQANIGSTTKRDVEREKLEMRRKNREAYESVTAEAEKQGAELIVWPETAIAEGVEFTNDGAPLPPADVDRGIVALGYPFLVRPPIARRALLVGGYADDSRGHRRERRFNVGLLRVPREDGSPASWSAYRKIKLMPFGERIPGQDWIASLKDVLPQTVPMTGGEPDQTPLVWERPGNRSLSITVFVCYEAIVPTLVARLADAQRPDLLVNLTNDSWYGDTWEPHQHLAFSRFRAVEHRSPMLRATNTGISAIVSSTGEVVASQPYNTMGAVVADVPLVTRPRTLYATTATAQPYAWWVIAFVAFLWGLRRHR